MARLRYSELISWIEKHPNYSTKFYMGVPASLALYIEFDFPQPGVTLRSETFDTVEGIEVVLDQDNEGIVYGFEIK